MIKSHRESIFIATFALLVGAITPNLSAQDSRMVILNVQVTDRSKRAIPDIGKDRFRVTEDGIAQRIELFSGEPVPLTYGLVIDNSGSLHSQFEQVISTGIKIISSNTFQDQAFLIRFIGSDRMEVMQECTFDKKLLIDGLQSMYIESGQTAVIDAVYLAAEKLANLKVPNGQPQRKALIVVTDGEDRSSYYRAEQLFKLLGTIDIQVFIIGLTSEVNEKTRDKAVDLIKRLAMDTGGRAFFPKSVSDLDVIGDIIISDIRTQYTIGYRPLANPPDTFHKVQISVAGLPTEESQISITRVRYSN